MHRFLAEPDVAGFAALLGPATVKAAVDDVLRGVRAHAAAAASTGTDALRDDAGGPAASPEPIVPAFDALLARVRERLARERREGLVEVLNGTGIVLHTNLGRAPLSDDALAAMRAVGGGYSNLEYDLSAGERGSRYARVTALLRETTGAADALVVNNCAAAVLLILDTFARSPGGESREVVVSRNQLVEIGGGFRLPDVLARSGATLVEVGATNKVYARDFERALTMRTALLLRSHTSNYRIEGFTADVSATELAALGARTGVPTVEDLGGGALVSLAAYGLPHERTVREAVADGIDLVAFSGDKLLGGPQCGIVVGAASMIARMRANPLLRALRTDKATLAALAATLRHYVRPGGETAIPFYAMLGRPVEALRARATALAAPYGGRGQAKPRAATAGLEAAVVATQAYAGGGSAPLATLPSAGLALRHGTDRADALARRLRTRALPLVARVSDGAVVVDLRAIPPERDPDVAAALAELGA